MKTFVKEAKHYIVINMLTFIMLWPEWLSRQLRWQAIQNEENFCFQILSGPLSWKITSRICLASKSNLSAPNAPFFRTMIASILQLLNIISKRGRFLYEEIWQILHRFLIDFCAISVSLIWTCWFPSHRALFWDRILDNLWREIDMCMDRPWSTRLPKSYVSVNAPVKAELSALSSWNS
jgi:hypothetical protein